MPDAIKAIMPMPTKRKYISLLSSSYGGMQINDEITNILMEESSAYFSGIKSMDDVIQVMRQRIQTVLNENS